MVDVVWKTRAGSTDVDPGLLIGIGESKDNELNKLFLLEVVLFCVV